MDTDVNTQYLQLFLKEQSIQGPWDISDDGETNVDFIFLGLEFRCHFCLDFLLFLSSGINFVSCDLLFS